MYEYATVSNNLKQLQALRFILRAHLSDISMFYNKYLRMNEVQMHAGAIRKLLYGCAYIREIIHSLKFVDYLPV